MATIKQLPDEIITLILEDEDISIEDIENFKSTCNRLQQITFSHKFWEKKFYQRFPVLKRRQTGQTDKEKLKEITNHLEKSVKCKEKLQHYVSLISHNNLYSTKIMQLNSILRSIAGDSISYHFILNDINRIISTQSLRHDSNLTVIYNFGLIYHWLKQYRLIYKQNMFIFMSMKKLLLERQVTIIAQYFQPYVTYSIIDTWLDDIVQEVLSRLKAKYPKHSVFSIPSAQFIFWRENNIDDNFWKPTESKEIMNILEEIMFSELGVYQLHQLLVTLDVKTKYINHVLEYYQECLLSIAYHCIARRLGLLCFLNCRHKEDNFVTTIIWKPTYYSVGHYLDYFYMKDKSLQYPLNIARGNCYFTDLLNPLYNILQIQKMIAELPRFCELKINNQYDILHNWKVNNLKNFSWRCLKNFIDDINIEYEYRNFINLIKNTANIVKHKEIRDKEIKYTIGMIVTHSPKPYLPSTEKCNPHTGVIIGWNYKCKAAFIQKKLKSVAPHLSECCETRHMCFCKCYTCQSDNSRFTHQPHYIILAESNIVCYAPQDTVSSCSPKWINNVEIGRYFSHFEGTHYVPTKNLAKNYPTDIAIMHQILSDRQCVE